MSDKLSEMFRLRSDFMTAIKERYPSSYPDWPVDVSKKRSQKALRETALKGVSWPTKYLTCSSHSGAEFLQGMFANS